MLTRIVELGRLIERIYKVLVRINTSFFSSLYERVKDCAGFSPFRSIGKQEFLSSNDEWIDATLGKIVGELETPILIEIENMFFLP